MDNKDERLDGFDLEDILKEFSGSGAAEEELLPREELEEVFAKVEQEPASPEKEGSTKGDTIRFERLQVVKPQEAPAEADAPPQADDSDVKTVSDATSVFTPVAAEEEEEDQTEEKTEEASDRQAEEPSPEPVPSREAEKPLPPPIPFDPRAKLRELKKKLVAGPERRYYELTEIGVGKLQIAILVNLLIVAACGAVAFFYAKEMIPESRLRLVIFSQVLAMMVSALLSCFCLMDGLGDLFRGKFTMNTMLFFTLAACVADAVLCLQELRIPCCAAFSLEATFALWYRYEQRNTEMGQMDTMRKASRLGGVFKVSDYYDGRPGLLRGEGQIEDFMDNYSMTSGPQRTQMIYTFIAFLGCIGIAVFAYLRHGISMAMQIFSTALLVATPASFFVALSRPMAVLERRLHMVGTVLCGWQGVKKLCGKAAFPLSDDDLFPSGSIKLNGVKFFGDRDPDQVVAYATALIRAAGDGLEPVFNQMLKNRSGATYKAESVREHANGGLGGEVWGESVLMGSSKLLEEMGVEIPEGTAVEQAVYCAIDGQLCAVFAMTYSRMKSSAAGIVSLCAHRKLRPVLTSSDFMLTDVFLKSKFGVNTKRIAFPPKEERLALAARVPGEEDHALALTTHDTLSATAYAVSGARALRSASIMGLVIHILGGVLGMLIMLALAYLGSVQLLTPLNILLYQLVWMIPGLLITELTRTV